MSDDNSLPEPVPDGEVPDGWERVGEHREGQGSRIYENRSLDLFVYVYADSGLPEDAYGRPRSWGVNLERYKQRPDHAANGGEKEQQVAATSCLRESVGSADDAATLHATAVGYMATAERLAEQ